MDFEFSGILTPQFTTTPNETETPFVNGTKVRVRISHDGTAFTAEGTVVYARARAGMGIGFTSMDPSGVVIVENWLSEVAK